MKHLSYSKQIAVFLQLAVFAFVILFNNAFAQEKSGVKPKLDIQNMFTASGWMGDGEYGRKYIEFEAAFETSPKSQPTCIKIQYTFGPRKWAGIYWQNKPDNWGAKRGNSYSKKGFSKVTFWAKGETGKEVVAFKAGGISDSKLPYHDSFEETVGRVALSKEWKQYSIDLVSADLSSVIGGFCWVASSDYNNQKTIIFYIDDIYFE